MFCRKVYFFISAAEVLCSCSPFECTCRKDQSDWSPSRLQHHIPQAEDCFHSCDPPAFQPHPFADSCMLGTYRTLSAVPIDDQYLTESAANEIRILDNGLRNLTDNFQQCQKKVNVINSSHLHKQSPGDVYNFGEIMLQRNKFESVNQVHCCTEINIPRISEVCEKTCPVFASVKTQCDEKICRLTSSCGTLDSSRNHVSSKSISVSNSSQCTSPKNVNLIQSSEDVFCSQTTPMSSTDSLFNGPSKLEELCTAPVINGEPRHMKSMPTCNDISCGITTISSSSFCHLSSDCYSSSDMLSFPLNEAYTPHFLMSTPSPMKRKVNEDQSKTMWLDNISSANGYFEELRPICCNRFLGNHVQKSAFDVFQNTWYHGNNYNDGVVHFHPTPSLQISQAEVFSSPFRTLTPATVFQQKTDLFSSNCKNVNCETGPTRETSEKKRFVCGCFVGCHQTSHEPCNVSNQRMQQVSNLGLQPEVGVYKKPCNHSINITLTYD